MSKSAVLLIAAILFLTTGFQKTKRDLPPIRHNVMTVVGSEWSLFAPKDGGFSVMLPGKPTEETLHVDSPTGPITVPSYKLESGEFGYMITYRDSPTVPEETQALENLLQMVSEKAVTSAPGSKLISSKAFSFGDHPAREVKAEIRGPSILQTRSYFVRPRLYILMVFMPLDKTDSEYVTKYFESFKVPPAGPTVQP